MDRPTNIFKRDDIPVKKGISYLSDPASFADFQRTYLAVREKEYRLLTEEDVRALPYLPSAHALSREWLLRADTLKRFSSYLEKHKIKGHALDLGCGNGWFSHLLAGKIQGQVVGLDVNLTELEQAAGLFQQDGLHFCFGNIFEDLFLPGSFGLIVLNASAQYFPDLVQLLERLIPLLQEDGEIHLLDTQFYADENAAREAAGRSKEYYTRLGFPEMTSHYHHHELSSLMKTEKVQVEFLYKPPTSNSKLSTLKYKISNLIKGNPSPFPWIRIRHKTG